METSTSRSKIETAIRLFLRNDHHDLMQINIHEMALGHRIAVYMEKEFPEHNVDCEYNKRYDGDPKEVKGRKIRPDIIVHRRGGRAAVAIIELKKAGHASKAAKKEMGKLKDEQSVLGYPLAVYIGILKSRVEVVWIVGGEAEECMKLVDHSADWLKCLPRKKV